MSHKERSHHRSLSELSRRLRVVVIWSFSPVQFHLCTSTWRCLPSFPKQRSGCLLEQKTWSKLLCFEHRKASKWQPCVFSELLVFYRESDDLKWANRTWWGARLHRPPCFIFAQITLTILCLSPVWIRLVFWMFTWMQLQETDISSALNVALRHTPIIIATITW